jgi:hypothetical protein
MLTAALIAAIPLVGCTSKKNKPNPNQITGRQTPGPQGPAGQPGAPGQRGPAGPGGPTGPVGRSALPAGHICNPAQSANGIPTITVAGRAQAYVTDDGLSMAADLNLRSSWDPNAIIGVTPPSNKLGILAWQLDSVLPDYIRGLGYFGVAGDPTLENLQQEIDMGYPIQRGFNFAETGTDYSTNHFATWLSLDNGNIILMAKQGMWDLTEYQATTEVRRMTGTLTNVVYQEVISLGDDVYQFVNGGCTVQLATFSFSDRAVNAPPRT